jgi:hypothetical protein
MQKPLVPPFPNHYSLVEYQKNTLIKFPLEVKQYKEWRTTYYRNILWKPINQFKLDNRSCYFPVWKFEEFSQKYPKHSSYHQLLMKEAQKYNPDEKVHLETY